MIEEEVRPKRGVSRVGNGPPCPVNPAHGRLYSWDLSVGRYFCPHSDHGGNGKFFSEKEANGEYELGEDDVSNVFDAAVRDIQSGRTTLDQAVQQVARATKRSSSSVREAMNVMIQQKEDTSKVTDSSTTKTTKPRQRASKPQAAPGEKKRRLEAVEGARFKAVLDEYALTPKQAAEATGNASMGKSSTYIYILTHDGASIKLFKDFEAAIKAYVKENKIKRVKPKEAVGPVPVVGPSAGAVDDETVEAQASEPEPDAEDDETPVAEATQ